MTFCECRTFAYMTQIFPRIIFFSVSSQKSLVHNVLISMKKDEVQQKELLHGNANLKFPSFRYTSAFLFCFTFGFFYLLELNIWKHSPRSVLKKSILKNSAEHAGKQLCVGVSFIMKVQASWIELNFYIHILLGICKMFKNTNNSVEHLRTGVRVLLKESMK